MEREHPRLKIIRVILVPIFIFFLCSMPLMAAGNAGDSKIGIILMHGKGSTPLRHLSVLASSLEQQGYLVRNLEMPWSRNRNYDVAVAAAEAEVEAALALLRERGATRIFLAGHSQGGLFALHFSGNHTLDGVIAIAPGGDSGSPISREKLGESVDLARKLITEGKGAEKARLSDFEGSKGTYTVISPPSSYLSWFDPDGAMSQTNAIKNINPTIPVLLIVPTNDLPHLLQVKQKTFENLPSNKLTKIYEPDASHLTAPIHSVKEIVEWTTSVAGATRQ